MSCIVNHNITATDLDYEWYLGNRLISSRGSFLTLNFTESASVSQGGMYRCSAYKYIYYDNIYLYYNTDVRGYSPHVSILFSPSFAEEPESTEARVNDSIELSCTAFGYPVPVIKWNRITTEVSQDHTNNTVELPKAAYNDTIVSIYNVTSTLIIPSIQYDDFGNYLCVAALSSSELSEDVQVISSVSTITSMSYFICFIVTFYFYSIS